jgi:hypothetical protein
MRVIAWENVSMKLRLLIACAIAATFIAGCSGGGGGSSSILQSPAGGSSMGTQSVSITLDRSSVGSSSLKRNAKFVAASVNDVSYAFVNGSNVTVASGDVALNSSNCVSSVCTITIAAVPVGTYTLNLTLKDSGIAVGSGSSSITVALGGTNNATVTISPILTSGSAGPSISIPSSPPVFYVDNESTQTLSATVNELDPVGDIICGSTKSVPIWPVITVSASGSVSGLSIPSPTVSTPPTCPGASGNVAITYSKQDHPSPTVTSVAISATDGTTTRSVTIPFISLSTSQTTALTITSPTPVPVIITETNGAYAGESAFNLSGCDSYVSTSVSSFSQGSTTSGSPDSTATLNITGLATAPDSNTCTLTVASAAHPELTTSLSLSLSPQLISVQISSNRRSANPAR